MDPVIIAQQLHDAAKLFQTTRDHVKVGNESRPPSKMVVGLSPCYTTFYNFHGRSWLFGVALRYVELFYRFTWSQTCMSVPLGVILHIYVAVTYNDVHFT